jgi:hypothetical protein
LRNAASTFLTYVPNAPLFVQLRTQGVAWPISLASRKISSIRYRCSRPSFAKQDTNASSCRSSIVSSILLRWQVKRYISGDLDLTKLLSSSIGAGASTATVKQLRRHFKTRKTPFRNISMHAPKRSSAALSIGPGDL